MAVDIHALNLFRLAGRAEAFGRVATIGRQNLKVPPDEIEKLMSTEGAHDPEPFCDGLLKARFGATLVDSYDFSAFEGATHIVDLNEPLATDARYDTIIDCGTLEHIYNVPQALKNLSCMCAERGRIIHVLPANNYCGHGFWQFSPELFYSLYSEAHGYSGTRVFLATVGDNLHWYEVSPPCDGKRADVTSYTRLLVLVITRKKGSFSHDSVQQSDYVHAWSQGTASGAGTDFLSASRVRLKDFLSRTPLFPVARAIYDRFFATTTLSGKNPWLRKLDVHEMIGQP